MSSNNQPPEWVNKAIQGSKKNQQQLFTEWHVAAVFTAALVLTLIFNGV